MSVSLSHKYRELLGHFDLQDSVQECQDIDAHALIATFDRGWVERKEQRPRILEKAVQLASEVDRLFDEVAARIHLS